MYQLNNMKLKDIFDTKNPVHLRAFAFSAVIFFLYSILVLIDSDKYVMSFNVVDVSQTTRDSLAYAYFATYVIFILKVLVLLITLFLIILIIRIIISTILHIFTPEKQSGGGINEMRAGALSDHASKIIEAVYSTMRWMLGFIISTDFIIIFFTFLPGILYISLISYLGFYNQNNIMSQSNDTSARIMTTYHNFFMFVITSLVLFSFVFCIYLYFKNLNVLK
jgi:hypothetical protein